jgi:hypothetical protein
MKKKLAVSPILLLALMAAIVFPETADRRDVTVHEWGTFTSIAGEDGEATPWQTYDGGTEDLPCFVNNFGGFKFQIPGTVRMETPVLYFYGSRDSVVDVDVNFPNGTITEWYPQQTSPKVAGSLSWHSVHVAPHAAPHLPTEPGTSHYYVARNTDAAALQVGSQNEKFLFYRGVGSFPLPISARATSAGKVVVKNRDKAVDGVILFENHGAKRRYLLANTINGEVTLDREALQDNWAGLLMDLERVLIDHGLYPKEARAMIETWRDSWFEEGARLFYIVPKQTIDSVLPLNIQPAPLQTTRVFVGRMEIITPEIQTDVAQAIARNDRTTLEKYGRFLESIAKRIGAKSPLIDSVYNSYVNRAANCRH